MNASEQEIKLREDVARIEKESGGKPNKKK
jgi:hypothetical protein